MYLFYCLTSLKKKTFQENTELIATDFNPEFRLATISIEYLETVY
jgi:hypothetical protein